MMNKKFVQRELQKLDADEQAGRIQSWFSKGKWSPETGLAFGRKIAEMTPRPTAIIVASDPMAVGGL